VRQARRKAGQEGRKLRSSAESGRRGRGIGWSAVGEAQRRHGHRHQGPPGEYRGPSPKTQALAYEHLVIATGVKSVRPPMPGLLVADELRRQDVEVLDGVAVEAMKRAGDCLAVPGPERCARHR
jgi:hypothetical protein